LNHLLRERSVIPESVYVCLVATYQIQRRL
jgi:hypothetical protein